VIIEYAPQQGDLDHIHTIYRDPTNDYGRNLSSNSSWLLAVGGWLLVVLPTTAGAHRLDEYLQATRVAIERERVDVDIDLTAGVSIAGQVTTWIDVNGDGEISQAESFAYARRC
jgi:hypothetical protein